MERKVIPVKCSEKLLVTVIGVILSGSVGFGAVLNVDGLINPADYEESVIDVDAGGVDFALTGLDIDTVYWGVAGDVTGVWYTLGMTVTVPPINTTGDVTAPYPTPTNVHLSLEQGGVEKYWFEATMFSGNVINFIAWDSIATAPITLDPANIKYAVDTGLEVAIKVNQLPNLAPAPFQFGLVFEGGGEHGDDRVDGTIPEPSTISMIVVGGLLTVVRRRRAKRLRLAASSS